MNETIGLPLKSVAGALIFTVLLGPVGLLYASTVGGTIMIFLSVTVLTHHFYQSVALLWVISCIWSVAAVNRYNQKQLIKG